MADIFPAPIIVSTRREPPVQEPLQAGPPFALTQAGAATPAVGSVEPIFIFPPRPNFSLTASPPVSLVTADPQPILWAASQL